MYEFHILELQDEEINAKKIIAVKHKLVEIRNPDLFNYRRSCTFVMEI